MSDTQLVQPIDGISADLPSPYWGRFERVITVRTGDCVTRMDVYILNRRGRPVYVRSFVAPQTHDCEFEFYHWMMGHLNQRP